MMKNAQKLFTLLLLIVFVSSCTPLELEQSVDGENKTIYNTGDEDDVEPNNEKDG